ncbi:MAG: hypothetical protein OXH84_00275 [Gammaproteobacteria bacterium]|nr:hypothetical protein [Gammaproteobacteria bacterium]
MIANTDLIEEPTIAVPNIANDWYTTELDYDQMREVRRRYYAGRNNEPSLNESKEFNIGLIVRYTGLELNYGLLHVGYIFPYRTRERSKTRFT